MISNVSTPLLGVVDTGSWASIPDPAYIGAVALGALVFNFVFWGFGFLRMGTTGLTAQALGAADAAGDPRQPRTRGADRAMRSAPALVALQWPIRELAFALLDGSPKVEALARDYYDIRIWAAPATLDQLRAARLVHRTEPGAHGARCCSWSSISPTWLLDVLFVLGLRHGREGRGAGNGDGRGHRGHRRARHRRAASARPRAGAGTSRGSLHPGASRRTIAVNRDIMIRSLR